MRKNDAFDAKIVNTRLTEIFIAIFAPDERLPSSATLPFPYLSWTNSFYELKTNIYGICAPKQTY